jgi:flavin reductase (DIM6/NTAB) family NADH-FMN oxidoreductase RutF
MVMFSSEGVKDSVRNASQTGEFVCNYVSRNLEDDMNATSVPAPAGISEFDHCNIEKAPSNFVSPPRVAKAYAALECKVTGILETQDVNGDKTGAVLVMGQVMGIHIDEAVIKDGRFDVTLANPVTRMGYLDYSLASDIHQMPRPEWTS